MGARAQGLGGGGGLRTLFAGCALALAAIGVALIAATVACGGADAARSLSLPQALSDPQFADAAPPDDNAITAALAANASLGRDCGATALPAASAALPAARAPSSVASASSNANAPAAKPASLPPSSNSPAADASSNAPDAPLSAAELPSYIKSGWRTDFAKHSIDYGEIMPAGIPRDGIPPIDAPRFAGVGAAFDFIADDEPALVLSIGGEAKAYPLSILMRREIVNDAIGGVDVAVTYCPLCNSGVVFDRRVNGVALDFGVTGNLRFSDMLMWDRQTESWWQQIGGEAVVGEMTGARLNIIPSAIAPFGEFRRAHPDGKVLAGDAGRGADVDGVGADIDYDAPAYAGYDDEWSYPSLLKQTPDLRMASLERVMGLRVGGVAAAYPFRRLRDTPVVNDAVGGVDVAVFYSPDTLSPFGGADGATARQRAFRAGSATAHIAAIDGRRLSFALDGGRIVDEQTGSVWNALGGATAGPLAGATLEPLPHGNYFWFAWAAFNPDTEIRDGAADAAIRGVGATATATVSDTPRGQDCAPADGASAGE